MAEISIIEKKKELPKVVKVAAYCRVSVDKDSMLHSLSNQVSYFSKLIQSNKGWKYVGVYSDEGITGTKGNRAGFTRMIEDARKGLIDVILTKSLSRFARNTVDCLRVIRELKDLGVDVYFEEQNIHTLSANGEFMITLLAGYAQEESRQVSENTKWRIKKNYKEGRMYGGWIGLGYDVKNGNFRVNEIEANTVRKIFSMYLDGYGSYRIANELNEKGLKTKKGNKFNHLTIMEIIRNEAYTGTLVLQKQFSENHLTKKTVINKGERDMYVVDNNHEAIVSMEDFKKVQEIRISRKPKVSDLKGHIFSMMIECSNCHCHFIRKTNNNRPVWMCSGYINNGERTSYQLREDILIDMVNKALGMDAFDEKLFRQKIKKIVQKPDRILEFHFTDGSVKPFPYVMKSRKDSWTEKMKEEARRYANSKDNTKQD